MKLTSLVPALAAAALAIALPGAAQAMTAAEWVTRWQALAQMPAAEARASPEFVKLSGAFAQVASGYRAQLQADASAGRPPRACPPKRVSLSAEDLLLELQQLPPQLYAGDFGVAFTAVMDKRYPCTPGMAPPPQTPEGPTT